MYTSDYLETCLEAPTRRGDVFSLQASISFFNMNRHSRNIEKKGWCDSKHRDVREWFRTRCNSNRHQNVETVPNSLPQSARYVKMMT